MTGITHILVPTDGSEGSLHAAELAGCLARSLNAKVTLLSVRPHDSVLPQAWEAGSPAKGAMPVEQARNLLEQQTREHELAETAAAVGELTTPLELIVAWGHFSEEICRFATENNVDHIVMGSHGRSGLKRAFLGSVSQAVANQAPCPVTIVR